MCGFQYDLALLNIFNLFDGCFHLYIWLHGVIHVSLVTANVRIALGILQ